MLFADSGNVFITTINTLDMIDTQEKLFEIDSNTRLLEGTQRTERLTFRFSPAELKALKALAESEGLNTTDLIRHLIQDAIK